jgi:PPOX class probable F420-dependent enzyme
VLLGWARDAVASARVARLATIEADGRAHLVPVCFALDQDSLYSAVDAKPKTTTALRRLANVAARPEVTVLVDHYEEDWDRLWWVRLKGRARVESSGPALDLGLSLLADKYPQYRRRPPPGPVLVVELDEVRAWSASGPPA